MVDAPKAVKAMPRGVRKGGARFPRHSLEESLPWARKLVSKTHLAAQPQDIVYSAVVGAKNSRGDIRISALKQYGLMEGDSNAYVASELAKQIVAAPDNERTSLYRQATLRPTIFRGLFDTFHGDTITRAKLKQRASELSVHPDETERCVEHYLTSFLFAELVTIDGDKVTHLRDADLDAVRSESTPEINMASLSASSEVNDNGLPDANNELEVDTTRPRAVFNVNVTLDASLDVDKLAKQLELLKKFGAI